MAIQLMLGHYFGLEKQTQSKLTFCFLLEIIILTKDISAQLN